MMSSHPVNTALEGNQVENNAGGFVYKLSDVECLKRFLVLGSDTNTFYASAKVHPAKRVKARQNECIRVQS
jgi:60 kDa SS-A/Ro ribonucleoprotein